MDTDPLLVSGASAPAAAPAPARDNKAQSEEVRRLAHEFEALLMTQMLRDMRKSLLSNEDGEDSKHGPLMDVADAELGRALSNAGGFGLTDVLMSAMRRQLEGGASSNDSDPRAFAAALAGAAGLPIAVPTSSGFSASFPTSPATRSTFTPSALTPSALATSMLTSPGGSTSASAAALEAIAGAALGGPDASAFAATGTPAQPGGPVTSGFGWRSDPLTGVLRFHSGVDIAMAYGHDVQAAAPGRVVFAGTSGDYGNMVVLEHAGGRQTRYAHLAEPLVREGDSVDAGQIIGKSGSSGRSTGPHLHFEVLSNGQAVDPSAGGGRP